MMKKHLPLSNSGKISVMIALALYALPAWSQGIIPSNHNTSVSTTKNGVEVVNIATPNAAGLSHNTYNRYDVSSHGAVLNNSLSGGNAQLANNLSANANLRNGAAKVILNEVVQNNPSLLLGKQEVFGMVADYVLANPNGISCQGCGFINTNRATLVVGKPQIDGNGRLQEFAVGTDRNNNRLSASGDLGGANVLDLIAPRIDANGNIRTDKAINVVTGRQHVAYDDLHTRALSPEELQRNGGNHPVWDGEIFGSMSAGQIHIHNSDPQAATHIEADLTGKQQLDVQAAGKVHAIGGNWSAQDIRVDAADVNIESGVSTMDHQITRPKQYIGHGVTREASDSTYQENLNPLVMQGDSIQISARNNARLGGTQVKAQNLNITADNIDLDSITTTQTASHTETDRKGLWFHRTRSEHTQQAAHGNEWDISQNANISATGTVSAQALNLKNANTVAIRGGKGVDIGGTVSTQSTVTTNGYMNETRRLKTGRIVDSQQTQNYLGSNIQADNIQLGGENITLKGVQINGKNIQVNDSGKTTITTEKTANSRSHQENSVYALSLGGGETHITRNSETQEHSGSLNADTIHITGAKGVKIAGSTLNSKKQIHLDAADGEVSVHHVFNHQSSLQHDLQGGLFDIPLKSDKTTDEADTTVSSAILSQGDILLTGKQAAIVGSRMEAGNTLNVQSKTLTSDVADAQHVHSVQTYRPGVVGYTKKDGDKLQATAGARLQGVIHTVGTTDGTATANTLTGKKVSINSDTVHLKGSQINSTVGEADIHGKNVTLAAGDVKQSGTFDYTNTSSAGIYATVGVSKVAVGVEVGTEQHNHTVAHHKAVVTTIQTPAGVNLSADETLQNNGTAIRTPGKITLAAKDVKTEAAADVTLDHDVTGSGGVTVEAYAKPSPALGGSINFHGAGNGTLTVDRKAVVTQLSGSNIDVASSGSVTDVGTHYDTAGDVTIRAPQYDGKATANTRIATTNAGNAQVQVDAYTSTTQDVTVELGGSGAYQYLQDGKSQAVLGNIKANNIRIEGGDIKTAMNMDAGKITLQGQNVTLAQADNADWKTLGGFDAGGSLGATYVPGSVVGVTPAISAKGGFNYLGIQNSQAAAANLKAQDISVTAQENARAEGTNINADHVAISGKSTNYDAAYDRHHAFGINLHGNASLKLSISGDTVTGGGAGIGANFGLTKENSFQGHGGHINAKQVALTATGSRQDMTLAGTRIDANQLTLSNHGGDVSLTAAKGEVHKGNFGFGGNLGAGASQKGLSSLSAGGNFDLDTENSESYAMGQINAQNVQIQAGKDLILQTRLNADHLQAEAGKNVRILAAQDKKHAVTLNVAAHLGGSPVVFSEKTTAADVAKALNGDFQNGTVMGIKADGKFNIQVNHRQNTQQSHIDVKNMDIKADGGQVAVNASKVHSESGKGFNGATLTTGENTDFVHDLGFHIAAETPDFKKIIAGLTQGKFISPITAGAHLHWEAAHPVKSEVDVK